MSLSPSHASTRNCFGFTMDGATDKGWCCISDTPKSFIELSLSFLYVHGLLVSMYKLIVHSWVFETCRILAVISCSLWSFMQAEPVSFCYSKQRDSSRRRTARSLYGSLRLLPFSPPPWMPASNRDRIHLRRLTPDGPFRLFKIGRKACLPSTPSSPPSRPSWSSRPPCPSRFSYPSFAPLPVQAPRGP